MKGGLKELKVFVDLAYISTGDDGMEIAKVTCFQSATFGYAPLIFHLDTNCDYNDFLERCKEVWKVLDSNPNLPKELVRYYRNRLHFIQLTSDTARDNIKVLLFLNFIFLLYRTIQLSFVLN